MPSIVGEKYKNSAGDLINKIIGEEGIKTDVAIKLAPATVPLIIIAILIGVTSGILLAGAIKKAIDKK